MGKFLAAIVEERRKAMLRTWLSNWRFPQNGGSSTRSVYNGNGTSCLSKWFRGTPHFRKPPLAILFQIQKYPLVGKILKDLLLLSNIVNARPQISRLIEIRFPAFFVASILLLKTHLEWNHEKLPWCWQGGSTSKLAWATLNRGRIFDQSTCTETDIYIKTRPYKCIAHQKNYIGKF